MRSTNACKQISLRDLMFRASLELIILTMIFAGFISNARHMVGLCRKQIMISSPLILLNSSFIIILT
jgi:uncharacterized membrane protein